MSNLPEGHGMRLTNLRLYCRCGAAWTGNGIPPREARLIQNTWDKRHTGSGCGPTDAAGARAARRRAEHEFERSLKETE